MPGYVLDALDNSEENLVSWVAKAATRLGVSGAALKWQMINTGRGSAELRDIPDEAFRAVQPREVEQAPPPFGHRYVARVVRSIERGHISASRAAALVGMSLDELGELCETFDIVRPAELQLGLRIAS